jgi:hypothetical protein
MCTADGCRIDFATLASEGKRCQPTKVHLHDQDSLIELRVPAQLKDALQKLADADKRNSVVVQLVLEEHVAAKSRSRSGGKDVQRNTITLKRPSSAASTTVGGGEVKAIAALKAYGSGSAEFANADRAEGEIWLRIREIRGSAGEHWMFKRRDRGSAGASLERQAR